MIRVCKKHFAAGCLSALVIVFSGSAQAESLVCVAESASGFVYDENAETWKVSTLAVEERKYLVAPANEDNIFVQALHYDYEITETDSAKPVIHCKTVKFPDSNEETGFIMCKGPFGTSFNIDKVTGRYIRSETTGYMERHASSASGDGPYMEIGNCKQQ